VYYHFSGKPPQGFFRAVGSLLDLYPDLAPTLDTSEVLIGAWRDAGLALRESAEHVCPHGPALVKTTNLDRVVHEVLSNYLTNSAVLSVCALIGDSSVRDPGAEELQNVLRRYIEAWDACPRSASKRPAESTRESKDIAFGI
jgi:hypothetical protein